MKKIHYLIPLLICTLLSTQATEKTTPPLTTSLVTAGALFLNPKIITTQCQKNSYTYTFYKNHTAAITGPFGENLGIHPTNNHYPKPHQSISLEKQNGRTFLLVGGGLKGGCWKCEDHSCKDPNHCIHISELIAAQETLWEATLQPGSTYNTPNTPPQNDDSIERESLHWGFDAYNNVNSLTNKKNTSPYPSFYKPEAIISLNRSNQYNNDIPNSTQPHTNPFAYYCDETKDPDAGDTNLPHNHQANASHNSASKENDESGYVDIIHKTFEKCGAYKKSNQPAIIVLGTTGVGKSTSIASFLGHKLVQKKDPNTSWSAQQNQDAAFFGFNAEENNVQERMIIDVDKASLKNTYPFHIDDLDNDPTQEESYKQAGTQYLSDICPRIGHKATACTLLPKRYESQKHKICLYDFAGFEDNRGPKVSFQVTLGSNLILSKVDDVQALLLVVSHDDVLDQKDLRHTKLNDQIFKVLDELTKIKTHRATFFARALIQSHEKGNKNEYQDVLKAIRKEYPILSNLFIFFNKAPAHANQNSVLNALSKINNQYLKDKRDHHKSLIYLFHMLDSTKHIFVCNPLQDPTSLLRAVTRHRPIPRKHIGFIGKQQVTNQIVLTFQDLTRESQQTIRDAIALHQEIQQLKNSISLQEKSIKEKKKAIQKDKKDSGYTESQIAHGRVNREKHQKLQTALDKAETKIEVLERQKSELWGDIKFEIGSHYYESDLIGSNNFTERKTAGRKIKRYKIETGSSITLLRSECEDWDTGTIWYKINTNQHVGPLYSSTKKVTVYGWYYGITDQSKYNQLEKEIRIITREKIEYRSGLNEIGRIDRNLDLSHQQKATHATRIAINQKDIASLEKEIAKIKHNIKTQSTAYDQLKNQIMREENMCKAIKNMLPIMPEDNTQSLKDYIDLFDKFLTTCTTVQSSVAAHSTEDMVDID